MKTKFLRFGKRSLSVALSVLMIVSSVLVGNIGTINASAADESVYLIGGVDSGGTLSTLDGYTLSWASDTANYDAKAKLTYVSDTDYYIAVEMTQNLSFFRFLIGTTHYGYSSSQNTNVGVNSSQVFYKKNSNYIRCFKFTGTSGKYRIHITKLDTGGGDCYFIIKPLHTITTNYSGCDLSVSTQYAKNTFNNVLYAEEGETVTYTVSDVPEGYTPSAKIGSNPVSLTDNEDGTYTYSGAMSTSDVVFNVECVKDLVPHNISYSENYEDGSDATGNGTFAIKPTTANENSAASFTLKPPTGYVATVAIKDSDNNNVTYTKTDAGSNGYTYTFAMPTSDATVNITYKDHYTVWFNNKTDWSTVNVYAFSGTGNNATEYFGTCPGTAIQENTNKEGYYGVNVDINATTIIFNGTDSNGSSIQTGDLAIVNDAVYYYKDKSSTDAIEAYGGSIGLSLATAHNATIASGSASYITLSQTSDLYTGTTVTATVSNIPSGKSVGALTVSYREASGATQAVDVTPIGNNQYTFNMPDADVEVAVSFQDLTKHTVTINKVRIPNGETDTDPHNGKVEGIDAEGYYLGDTVTATSTPLTDGDIATVTVTTTEGNTTVESKTRKRNGAYVTTFTMPDEAVTLTVTFKTPATYTVKGASNNASAGSVTPSSTVVSEGDSVVLNAKVDDWSYYFSGWTASSDDYELLYGDLTSSSYSIKVRPTADVTFTANFGARTKNSIGNYFIRYGKESTNHTLSDFKNYVRVYNDLGSADYAVIDVSSFERNKNYCFALTTSMTGNPVRTKQAGGCSVEIIEGNGLTCGLQEYTSGNTIYTYIWISFAEGVTSLEIRPKDRNGSYYGLYSNLRSNSTTVTAGDGEVLLYAKDGTVRTDFDKFPSFADTRIVSVEGEEIQTERRHNDKVTVGVAEPGDEVVIETEIDTNTVEAYGGTYRHCDMYRVEAFNVSGVTYMATKKAGTDNIYTATITVPENVEKLEITPIFFYNSTKEQGAAYSTFGTGSGKVRIVRFEVENFDEAAKADWKGILACYPYYVDEDPNSARDKSGADATTKPTLGGFPGQPMVQSSSGNYYIEFPVADPSGNTVCGMTINNYIWDDVHAEINISENCKDEEKSPLNYQTYDYNDFKQLASRTDVDTIYFRFKYMDKEYVTSKDTEGDAGNIVHTNLNPTANDQSYRNGFELYRNHENKPTDLFGNELPEPDSNAEYVYVVSDGYQNTTGVGLYATKWAVYPDNTGNGEALTSGGRLTPSVLFYNYKSLSTDSDGKINWPSTRPSIFVSDDQWTNYKALVEGGTNTKGNTIDSIVNKYVMITYESSIYGGGQKAHRCDGRWFVPASTVSANITIEYLDDNGIWQTDTVPAGSTVGDVTGASAYFTTSDIANKTSTGNVSRSTTTNFDFSATTNGKTLDDSTYKFVGWYNKIDANYNDVTSSNSTGSDNISRESGSVDRSMTYSLVARYQKVASSDLTISHNLLSQSPDTELYDDAGNQLTPGKGKAKTYVQVTVVDSNGNPVTPETENYDASYTYEYAATEDNISIPSMTLQYFKKFGWQLKVTLKTVGETKDDKFDALYDREIVTDGETSSVKYYRTSSEAPICKNPTSAPNSEINESSKIETTTTVYTISLDGLYTGNTLTTKTLRFFSNAKSNHTVSVEFKYYDRKVESGKATTIDTNAKTLTYTTQSFEEEAVTNDVTKIVDDAVLVNGKYIDNVIDSYEIWHTQADAEASIPNQTNYRQQDESKPFGFGTYEEFSAAKKETNPNYVPDYAHHTDAYSRLSNDAVEYGRVGETVITTTNDYWVTYYDLDDTVVEIYDTTAETYVSESDVIVHPENVSKVVVWAFNTPKLYKVDVYAVHPDLTEPVIDPETNEQQIDSETGELLTQPVYATLTQSSGDVYYDLPKDNTTSDDVNYFENTENNSKLSHTVQYGLYNQRVGGEDIEENAIKAGSNTSSEYLNKYFEGSTVNAYVGTGDIVSSKKAKTEAGAELEFDGWYILNDDNSLTKISSDTSYGNRITSELKIVAGYRAKKSTDIGVSVIKNAVEYNVTQNDDDTQTKTVRLNTQLNVYGAFDSDKNIKEAAVIYVRFPNEVTNAAGEKVPFKESMLNDIIDGNGTTLLQDIRNKIMEVKDGKVTQLDKTEDEASITNVLVEEMYLNESGRIVSYTYNVNGSEDETKPNLTKITLTNKNRVQFLLNSSVDAYEGGTNAAIIAFAAIKYDGLENNTTNGWILSDNYVSYIYEQPGDQ